MKQLAALSAGLLICVAVTDLYAQRSDDGPTRAKPNVPSAQDEGEETITRITYLTASDVVFTGPGGTKTTVKSLGRLRMETNVPVGPQLPIWDFGVVLGDVVGENAVLNAAAVRLISNDPSGYFVFEADVTFLNSQNARAVARWRFGGSTRVWAGPVDF